MSDLLSQLLVEALGAHGIACRRDGDRVVLENGALVFRANVHSQTQHPNSLILQTDFETEAPLFEGRVIRSSFAGVGADEDAAASNAFMKFMLGPFHVLLGALADHVCDQGSEEWSAWKGDEGVAWRVCDSPLITQGVDDPASIPIKPVLDELMKEFVAVAPSSAHWVDVFFASMDGKRIALEVQLDGLPWPEGARVFEAWNYAPKAGYVSGRYFFIALIA